MWIHAKWHKVLLLSPQSPVRYNNLDFTNKGNRPGDPYVQGLTADVKLELGPEVYLASNNVFLTLANVLRNR